MDFLSYLGLTSAATGRKGDVYEVTFPEKRPLGLKVAIRALGDAADSETAIVVVAMPRVSPDTPGTVEATGMVKIGDELVRVCHSTLPFWLKRFGVYLGRLLPTLSSS